MSTNPDQMNSGQWQRLNEIFAAAIELDPDRQSEFLREACAGDESLQREAEAILAATQHADRQGFLHGNAFADGAQVLAANEIPPGTIIGSYRVVEEIGRGGMGAVYLATREGFQQRVALKIIKRGMDTESIVRRFVMEREVLASLNHPNIARLFDGGTTDGLPFIVMEYVEGKSITAFCDQRRLTIDERLILFRKVCAAVVYAHQNLVVHRDIKPSNILVTPEGEPKLLDFGIAKVLSSSQAGYTIEPTAVGAGLMTPEYASPEQIRGEKVTTASDIYSLGVLLYEMLSGHQPFRFKSRSAGDMLQVISERQPLSPSAASTQQEVVPPDHDATREILTPDTVAEMRSEKPARLKRKLAGDLDNIVLMALRKEPERRYQSVQQFVDDVTRHLEGLPVGARRATLSYRAAKFFERNRTASLFASLALVAILAGLSIAIWQAVVARRQWERAERRSTEVRRLANTLLKDLQNEVVGLPGSDRAREKLYEVSIEYLNGLARETNDPAVLKELSEAYVLLGKQYGYENRKPEEISACILQGLEISRRLAVDYPNDLEVKKLLAANLVEYDFFCEREPAAKLKLNQERARLWEELVKAQPSDGDTCEGLASAYYTLNYLFNLYERPDEAAGYRRLFLQAREREVHLLDKAQATNHERDLLAGAYITLGSTYAEESEDLQTAEGYFKRALTVAENLVAEHPDYRLGWIRLSAANREIAEVRYKQGDYQGALDHFRSSLRVVTDATAKLTDAQFRDAEATYMLRVAQCLYRTGRRDEAMQMLRDAAALNSQISQFGSTEAATDLRNARFLLASGEVYAALGLKQKALDSYRQADDLWKQLAGLEPQEQAEADSQIGRLHLLRGDLYTASLRDGETARHEYQAAVDMLSKLKAGNQIGLGGLRELHEAQQKLRAPTS